MDVQKWKQPLKIFRKTVFYKQVLEFHRPSKFLCQTSRRQNQWSLQHTRPFMVIGMPCLRHLCTGTGITVHSPLQGDWRKVPSVGRPSWCLNQRASGWPWSSPNPHLRHLCTGTGTTVHSPLQGDWCKVPSVGQPSWCLNRRASGWPWSSPNPHLRHLCIGSNGTVHSPLQGDWHTVP